MAIMLQFIALAPFFLAAALADIVPKPLGTTCPYGFDSFGLYCVVRDSTPRVLPSTDGKSTFGFDRSGSYCVARGRAPEAAPKSGLCPYDFDGSGAFCIRP
jgi:hypothetical protein